MSQGFTPVSKSAPCPACGKPDWCAWGRNGLLKCQRSAQPPLGMRLISTKDGASIFAYDDESGRKGCRSLPAVAPGRPVGSSLPPPRSHDFEHEAMTLCRALMPEQLEELGGQLRVNPATLGTLGCGWAGSADLARLGAGGAGWPGAYPDGAYTFPERDGTGRVVGLSLRTIDGRKGSPAGKVGSRRGLIIPPTLSSGADPVLIVEGLSDVAAALTLGLTAVGRPSCSSGADDLAALLAGRRVLVLGENDAKDDGDWPGQRGAEQVAATLASSWNVPVAWTMPPEGVKDLRSWLGARIAAGLDLTDTHSCTDAGVSILAELESRATSVGSVSGAPASIAPMWPEPQPLPEGLPPVMSIDPDLLPEAFRPWVTDIALRVQCPMDFPAVGAMVALAGVVGRKLGIRPKRLDDWTVVPNLWGGVVDRPGVMKTPALVEPLKPLKRLEILAKGEHDARSKEIEAAKLVASVKKRAASGDIKKSLKDSDEAYRLALESINDEDGEECPRKRYLVNDSSVEKLGEILNQNPSGVLVYRDELVGLLKSLDKDGQEGARTFFLEAWNGTGRYTFDRIGRGTLDIEAAIVSIIGGIQPGPLGQYLRGAAREGAGDDGLIQRFQLLVYPDISRDWENHDCAPDGPARDGAYAVFNGLDRLDPELVAADHDPHEPGGIPFLRFEPEAQERFDAWRADLERMVRSGELHPSFESHLSKYRSLIPSLALLTHLADGRTGPVEAIALDRAIRWGVYLQSHARRIYSHAIHPDLAGARSLARRVAAGELGTSFALREVYRKGWSALTTLDEARGAVELLIDLEWLAETRRATQGRAATEYLVNPRLAGSLAAKSLLCPPGVTDRTDRRGEG